MTSTPVPVAQYNVHEAKTQLSKILERVERGEEIVISRAGTPIARIVPIERAARLASRGSLSGWTLPDDWDSPETNEAIARDSPA